MAFLQEPTLWAMGVAHALNFALQAIAHWVPPAKILVDLVFRL